MEQKKRNEIYIKKFTMETITFLCSKEMEQLKQLFFEELYDNCKIDLIKECSNLILRVLLAEYDQTDDFFERINNYSYKIDLLEKYPLLKSDLIRMIESKVNMYRTVYTAYERDKDNITYSLKKNYGKVVNIITSEGDQHDGESVCKVNLSNGNIYYKPGNPSQMKLFYLIQDSILEKDDVSIRKINFYGTDSHTWVEEIEYCECTELKEIKDYYFNSGIYLFIFYMLSSYDMHFENIISYKSTPVVVDFETLTNLSIGDNHITVIRDTLNSVLNTMFIPFLNDNGAFDINVSGILSTCEESNIIENSVVNINQKVEMKRIKSVMNNENRIRYNGEDVVGTYITLEEVRQKLILGFTYASEKLIANRNKINELVRIFIQNNSIVFRQILRPTQVYGKFINATTHPANMKSLKDRDRLLMMLSNNFKPGSFAYLRVEKEIEDLKIGNIPKFYALANSKHLFSKNEIICENYFSETALEKIINKINTIDECETNYQISLINQSLLSLLTNEDFGKTVFANNENIDSKFTKQEILNMEKKYFSQLEDMEVKYQNNISTIIAPHFTDKKYIWRSKPIQKGLYEYGGMILTALYYGCLANDNKIIDFSIRLMNGQNSLPPIENKSVFMGDGSLIYLNYQFYKLLKETNQFQDKARDFYRLFEFHKTHIINELEKVEFNVIHFDYLYGIYSSLYLILTIPDCLNDKDKEIVDAIIKKLEEQIKNEKIKTKDFTECGFAHGRTGCALMLSGLYKYSKSEIIKKFILQLIDEENIALISNLDNINISWCRGYLGIIYGRELIERRFSENELNETQSMILRKFKGLLEDEEVTKKFLSDENFSLCHGLYGNIDIMKTLGIESDEFYIKRFDSINELNWLNGKINVRIDQFMLGNSGVAYSLLRLIDSSIPSIIALEV